MNDRLAKAEAIFHEALELPPEQREGFLQQACGEDAELLREVAALLRASGIADHWLKDDPREGERLPGRSHAEAGPREPERPGATVSLPITEKAGDRIGRYKLREKVGEGGCGVVYVAEQEEPVRRRVALKVIKLGMDTKSVIARFEAERQALAIMDHPNVAKVLDAGATETGRPFFVMELVRGIRITDYCDQNKLSTGERLDLFIKVCQAVQHAHQKGIIHRDLKPSNILVTLHDGVPVPKIIDFGIAKATEGRLTDLTVYTELNQFIGTPAYMSPEQAEMSGLDIDTRSDIYSLGVLLYELLTGQPPFDPKELLRQGLDEIRRTIREVEPPRPSTRLSTLAAASLGDVAQHRHTEAPKLMSLIRGDLDWIVMKCLEKDRTRRYETANGLAADIQRHLKQEPVVARPPSAAYRFQKLVRRNKLAFAAAGAVVTALMLGFAFSSWQALRARKAERSAQKARQAAEQSSSRESQQRSLAEENARKTATSERSARQLLYAADMRLAYQAWDEGNLSRMANLLEAHQPKAGDLDPRGFEYFYLQSLVKGEQEHLLHGDTNPVFEVAVSPDGKWLASRTATQVWLWDLATRKSVAMWPAAREGRGWAFGVSFSHDSQFLSVDGQGLQVCHVATRRMRLISSGTAFSAVFSPATNLIAFNTDATAEKRLGRIHIRDYLLNRDVAVLESPGLVLAWSPDGTRLLTGGWQSSVKWIDVTNWKPVRTNKFATQVETAAFSPDGRLAAVGEWQGEIHLLEAATGQEIGTLAGDDIGASALAFSPDGKRLASGSGSQAIRIWDVETKRLVHQLRGHHGKVTGLAYTPDGRMLVSAGMDASVRMWDATFQLDDSHITNHLTWYGINPPQFSPDGRFLGLATSPAASSVLDSTTFQSQASLQGENISFSPDGTQFAVWSVDRSAKLHVWTLGASTNRAAVSLEYEGHCPRLSPDGTIGALITSSLSSAGAEIILFEAATGETILAVQAQFGSRYFLANSSALLYVQGSKIRFLDLRTLKTTHSLECGRQVAFLALSPDGKTLAASHDDFVISLWNVDARTQIAKLSGHQSDVRALAFSPDGRTLASGGEDRTVRFWNLATSRELASVTQDQGVYWLSFSPDNQLLISGGIGSYRVWRAPLDQTAPTIPARSFSADLPTNSLWRIPDGPRPLPRRELAERNQCTTNLLKLHAAIMAYRKDHQQMPDWLSDAVLYLADTNALICPVHVRINAKPTVYAGMEDPKLISSYLYEFNAHSLPFSDDYGLAVPGDTMKSWKLKQLTRYGQVVPVFRCRHHRRVLNVTLAGDIMETGDMWEDDAERKLKEQQQLKASAATTAP